MDERDPRFEQSKRDEAQRLYAEGLSERAVAERMDLSKTRVRKLLDDAKVQRRPQAGKRQKRSRSGAARGAR